MPVLHIASFRWKPEVTPEQVEALTKALHEMRAQIPEIRSYVAAANLRLRPAGADYGVAAIVDDQAGLDAYLDHPLHLAIYEQYLGAMIDTRSAAQLPIESGSLA